MFFAENYCRYLGIYIFLDNNLGHCVRKSEIREKIYSFVEQKVKILLYDLYLTDAKIVWEILLQLTINSTHLIFTSLFHFFMYNFPKQQHQSYPQKQ